MIKKYWILFWITIKKYFNISILLNSPKLPYSLNGKISENVLYFICWVMSGYFLKVFIVSICLYLIFVGDIYIPDTYSKTSYFKEDSSFIT
jgi:hypothetical protein